MSTPITAEELLSMLESPFCSVWNPHGERVISITGLKCQLEKFIANKKCTCESVDAKQEDLKSAIDLSEYNLPSRVENDLLDVVNSRMSWFEKKECISQIIFQYNLDQACAEVYGRAKTK